MRVNRLRLIAVALGMLLVAGCESIFSLPDLRLDARAESEAAGPHAPVLITVTATNHGDAVARWDAGSSTCQLHLVVRVEGRDVFAPAQGEICTTDLHTGALGQGESRSETLAWSGFAQFGDTPESVVLLPAGTYELRGAAGRKAVSEPISITVQPGEPIAYCSEPPPARGPSGASSADPLFILNEAAVLSDDQARLLSVIRSRQTTGWVRVAELAEGAASMLEVGTHVAFPVAPGATFTATGSQVDRRSSEHLSWYGPLANDRGSVQLVLSSHGVTGTLNSWPEDGDPAQYKFLPLSGGLQAVVCVDVSKYPLD